MTSSIITFLNLKLYKNNNYNRTEQYIDDQKEEIEPPKNNYIY